MSDTSSTTTRAPNAASVAEREGHALIEDLRKDLAGWQDRLARHRIMLQTGRKPDKPIGPMLLEISNARRKLRTMLQGQPRQIRGTSSVTSLMLAMDRAWESAREIDQG